MNKRILIAVGAVAAVAMTAGGAWLVAATNSTRRIGPNTVDPTYIVVNTPTRVTFTSVIADSSLRKHDPKKVVLIRTDASGTPVDIIGRMNDRGKKADADRNDHTYTIQTTLNEPTVGVVQFRIAAKFKDFLLRWKDNGDDDDWDRDLGALNDPKAKRNRQDRLPPLLRKLQGYTLSDPIQVTVDPFKLPPDPGEVGKQTLAGIDSDRDGVRDDVERYIATSAASPRSRAARSQVAIAQQALLSGATSDKSTLAALDEARRRANQCLEFVEGTLAAAQVAKELKAEILNTIPRARAYFATDALVGGRAYFLNEDSTSLASSCAFNPATLR